MAKDKIGVFFGGRSQEHEISILSASSVLDELDMSLHDVIKIGISKDGNWYRIDKDMSRIRNLNDPRIAALIPSEESASEVLSPSKLLSELDFAFPVLHGPYGEDGKIQGLFDMSGIPYAGCGHTSSALAMDKIFAKDVLQHEGLPVLDFICIHRREMHGDKKSAIKRCEEAIMYPMFVKPANMGSSVGVSRVENREELDKALTEALKYDERIIVEETSFGREFEAAVIGNDEPEAALAVGEIEFDTSFYDYETKYRDGAARLYIPADISDGLRDEIRRLAVLCFEALGGSGFSRVDFFVDEKSGKPIINEMNTIPGLTQYSMFPTLWEASGLCFKDLIERIIDLGYERYSAQNKW